MFHLNLNDYLESNLLLILFGVIFDVTYVITNYQNNSLKYQLKNISCIPLDGFDY